jgi:hypothetical protein
VVAGVDVEEIDVVVRGGHGLSFVLPDAIADTARPCLQPTVV